MITNSVDVNSSLRNIEISRSCNLVIPFVGIHPEIFARPENANLSLEQLDGLTADIGELVKDARGIGEVGLDPRYGQIDNQEYLLNRILTLAESSGYPYHVSLQRNNLENPRYDRVVQSASEHNVSLVCGIRVRTGKNT